MLRRTFLTIVGAVPFLRLRPQPKPMFVGITPGFNAAAKANVAARIRVTGIGAPLDPPACLAFPGGAFTRARHAEMERLIYDMRAYEERFIRWMDRPRKGPRGRVRRAPGNLPKRLRKAARRA